MGRELPHGTTVGVYSIERLRERNGLSEVYAARGPSGEACRLSFFHIDPDGLPWKRFVAEAQQIRTLSHPCLAEIGETGVGTDGKPFQALVLGEGEDLGSRLRRGALTLDEAQVCAEQIGAAVLALHSLDLAHRGLSPERVFLASDGGAVRPRVRILDAGVTRLLDDAVPGVLVSNPEYKAPEQLGGLSIDVGPAVDQYTLALLLYQALTSSRPFKADSPAATILQVVRGGAEPLRVLRPDVSKSVDAAIMRALSKERHARFSSVVDFLSALRGGPMPSADLDELIGNWLRGSDSVASVVKKAQAQADSKPSFQVVALGMADASAGGVPEVVEDQATVPNAMDEVMRLALPIEQIPLRPSSPGIGSPAVPEPVSGPLSVSSGQVIADSRPVALPPQPVALPPQTDRQSAKVSVASGSGSEKTDQLAAPRSGISEQPTGPSDKSDAAKATPSTAPLTVPSSTSPVSPLGSKLIERIVIALIGLILGFLVRHVLG